MVELHPRPGAERDRRPVRRDDDVTVIETERLLLRPLGLGDLDEVVALHGFPEVSAFVGGLDRATAEERLRDNEREWDERGYGRLAIVERATARFIGRSGPKYWPDFDEVEVGWTLRPDAWGHGYATEAARASLGFCFATIDAPYFTAMIRPDNARSIAVAERLGMSVIRDDVLLGDAVHVFAIGRADG